MDEELSDRDKLAKIIDPEVFDSRIIEAYFTEDGELKVPNIGIGWKQRRDSAHERVDQILEFILNRVEEINPPGVGHEELETYTSADGSVWERKITTPSPKMSWVLCIGKCGHKVYTSRSTPLCARCKTTEAPF